MLFNLKLQLLPHHFATTLQQKQLVNIGYTHYIFCKCYLTAQKLACYLPQQNSIKVGETAVLSQKKYVSLHIII